MQVIDQLKQIIREEAEQLLCETHPESCRLRDRNYPHFEGLVMDFVFREAEPVSVQTAIAQLEQELSDATL